MPVHVGEEKTKHPRSVDAFCERQGICRGTFYNLAKRGLAPDILRIGARITVPELAEAEWLRRMTKPMQRAA